MALRRRNGESFRMGIWPGFVDAMTAMLLVFTFVLSIFMITQYFLRETILGQEEQIVDKDTALSSLTGRLDALSDMLSLEQGERTAAETRETLMRASLDRISSEKTEAERRLEAVAARLTAAETERDAERTEAERAMAEQRALEALASTLRSDLASTEAALDETATMLGDAERTRALEVAGAEALRKRLAESATELTAMEMALDDERAKAEETLLLLAAAREAEGALKESVGDTVEALSEKDLMLAMARSELATLGEASAEEQKQLALLNEQTRALREQLSAISAELEISEQARERLAGDTTEQGAVIASLGERLNIAMAEKNALLEEQVDELSGFRSEFFGRVRAALAGREDIVIRGDRFIFQSEVLFEPASADLNEQTRALREQLSAISAELEISEQARERLAGDTTEQGAVIASLGERLNIAMAEKNALLEEQVDELSGFRSEFFGRVRAALAGREDIVIRGDRFIFQSEVLFEPASADLNEQGIEELGKFAEILTDIAGEIPDDVDWILRIDGHTDSRPLLPGRTPYADNWELSQARALSVARYLIAEHDIAPRRLAPTGFGQFRPLSNRNTAEAYASNRRIELKLTER